MLSSYSVGCSEPLPVRRWQETYQIAIRYSSFCSRGNFNFCLSSKNCMSSFLINLSCQKGTWVKHGSTPCRMLWLLEGKCFCLCYLTFIKAQPFHCSMYLLQNLHGKNDFLSWGLGIITSNRVRIVYAIMQARSSRFF